MKFDGYKSLPGILLLLAAIAGIFIIIARVSHRAPQIQPQSQSTMKIISSAFQNRQPIPRKHTCDGEEISPPLSWSDVPEGAASLALIVDDPDAPSGTWVHWVVWNIDSHAESVQEGVVPQGGIQGITSAGERVWGGPCPPSGVHNYFFKLYALNIMLQLPLSATKADLERAMSEHTLASAQLVGIYSRK